MGGRRRNVSARRITAKSRELSTLLLDKAAAAVGLPMTFTPPPTAKTLDELPKLKSCTKEEKKTFDLKCPVGCGQCCEQSGFDPSIGKMTLTKKEDWQDEPSCPHYSKKGCKLPRRERPKDCTGFLCGVAAAVLRGHLTKKEAKKICDDMRPWLHTEFRLYEGCYRNMGYTGLPSGGRKRRIASG